MFKRLIKTTFICYKLWEQIDQKKVNNAFGTTNGEWRAYFRRTTTKDNRVYHEFMYFSPDKKRFTLVEFYETVLT